MFALFVCLGWRASRQEWSMVFKSWKSLEINTEGKKERRGGERERWKKQRGKKDWGGVEGGVFSFFISTAMVSGHCTYFLYECFDERQLQTTVN